MKLFLLPSMIENNSKRLLKSVAKSCQMGPKFRLPYGHRGGLAILEGKEPMSL